MTMMFAARILWVLTVVTPVALALWPTRTDAQEQTVPARRAPTYEQWQEKINAWTVGLAAGRIEGAPLCLASEMARVVDVGANLLVLPIVRRGPVATCQSLSWPLPRSSCLLISLCRSWASIRLLRAVMPSYSFLQSPIWDNRAYFCALPCGHQPSSKHSIPSSHR